jgi:hypothetical protein
MKLEKEQIIKKLRGKGYARKELMGGNLPLPFSIVKVLALRLNSSSFMFVCHLLGAK